MQTVGYNGGMVRRFFGVSLIFLAACSVFNGMDPIRIPTAIPGAVQIIVVQTAGAASTQTAAAMSSLATPSFTPLPNQLPSEIPADTPTFVFILPTPLASPSPEGSCPFSKPYYVRVRPFAVGSNNWNIYIPDYPKDAPYGFPATLFLQYVLNQSAWTLSVENIILPSYWLEAMAKINGSGWEYLQAGSNGTFFGGNTFGVDTFPGDFLLVTNRKYRRGECWDSVSSYPYSDALNRVPDLNDLPPYQLGLQTGMNYSTPDVVYPAPKNKGNIIVPILSKHGDLWLEDINVEAFPNLPMDVVVVANKLDIISSVDANSTVVGTVMRGAHLRLTDYSPTQRNTFGQVTDPATGKTGYVPLYNWTAWMTGSYTTTWTMETLPVPPGD